MKKQSLFYISFFSLFFLGSPVSASDAEYNVNRKVYNAIGADKAYELGFTGAGVTVAVVDTGTLNTHQEFNGQFSELQKDEFNVQNATTHGTSVSSVIVGKKDGVGMHGIAYGAKLVAFAVNLADEVECSDCFQDYSKVWELLATAEFNSVKIINNSLGASTNISPSASPPSEAEMEAARVLVAKDKLIVGSASNDTSLSPTIAPAGMPYFDPTLKNNFISAIAYNPKYNSSDSKFLEGYSNLALYAQEWSLAAPVYLKTATSSGDAEYKDDFIGTSAAAPVISGAAAVVSSAFPYMGGKQLADVLFSTADKNYAEFSNYMVQKYNGKTQFLFFGTADGYGQSWPDEEKLEKVQSELGGGYTCSSEGVACVDVSYADVFGQGLLNLGKAVNGPGYFDANRLSASDYDTEKEQYFYTVNTAGYDSIWSNSISEKTIDEKSIGLKKRGEGKLTLEGDNTFTGASIVEEGILDLSGTGSVVGDVFVDGGVFSLTGGTVGGGLTVNTNGSAVVLNAEVNDSIVNKGSFLVSGFLSEDVLTTGNLETPSFVNNNVLKFADGAGFSGTLNNNASFSVTGNSQLSGTIYNNVSGKMNVSEAVKLTVSDRTVENQGHLSGFGEIEGTVNNHAQGFVSSSLSISDFNSEGNIVLTSSGNETAAMRVDTLNITGGKFVLADENRIYRTGQVHTVIHFDKLTAFNNFDDKSYLSPFIFATPVLNGNQVDINIGFLSISEESVISSFSAEEKEVVKIIDKLYLDEHQDDFAGFYFYDGKDLKKKVNLVRSKAQPIQNESLPLTKVMSSQVHAHLFANTMVKDAARIYQPRVPMQRYRGGYYRGRSGGGKQNQSKIWGQFLGGWFKENSDPSLESGDIKTKTYGAMFGYDFEFSEDFLIGLTAGMAKAKLRRDEDTTNVEDFRAGFYTGSRFGKVTLNTVLMAGIQKYKSSRYFELSGIDLVNIGDFDGYSAEFDVNLGYDFMRLPYRDYSFYLRSYLAANISHIHQDAYEEKGSSSFALGVNALDDTTVSISPGLTLGYTFSRTVLTLDVGYQRMLNGDSVVSKAFFLSDAAKMSFSSLESKKDQDFFNAGLGLKTNITKNVQAHFWAGTRLSENTEALNLSATFSYNF